MSDKNMNAKVKVNFTKASTRKNITSGENISTSFGKISKYLDDLGTAAFTNSSDYATITDLSNKVDKANGKELMPSDLLDANGNIALSHLPDIVLGQMIYGGTVNASNVATLSTNAKTKLGTTSNTITLTNNTTAITGYVANEGIYYIATGNATLANLGIKTGDWLLSTGSAWKKIDNTDEVSSVNGKTGAVTLNASDVNAVSTSANQNLTDTQKANARTNIGAGTSSFDGDYNSLSNPPTIPPAVAVKGNAESTYRTGNVNLTPANIGAATSAQGTKADNAVQTIKMNGNAVTKTSGVVDLGTVITAHQDISGKADKSATVSNVTYDTTNKKLTKTINGTTSDIVTTAKLKTDMALSKSDVGLGNVGNFKAVSTAASQGLTDTEKANARTNIGAGTSSFSGSYNDLSNKPTIPTVNNGTLTIQKNGTTVATFTANQSGNSTANIAVPTKVSELTNDSGYTTNTGTVTQVKVGSTAYNPSSGVISLPAYPTKSSLGLGNVNNTSDLNKPISTATQAALDSQQAQLDKALEQTGYNLVKITVTTQTVNGITFIIDKKAGTITANGTATALTTFALSEQLSKILEVGNSYYMTGCPAGGSYSSNYALYVALNSVTVWRDEGSGEQYSVPQSGTLSALHLVIRSGVTVNNLVFKPMIVPAELAGIQFQPYAKSNVELTQKALLRDDNNDIITTNNDTRNITLEGSKIVIGANSSDSGAILIKENSGGGSIGIGNNQIQINSATRIGLNSSSISLLDTHGNLIQTSTANGIQLSADNITLGTANPRLTRDINSVVIETDTHTFWMINEGVDPPCAWSSNDGSQSISMYQSGDIEILGKTINIQPDEIKINNITMPYANNAGFHNSIYRGKNLGTSYTAAQKAQVQAGTFDDLFVGDYWLINNINWRIAHFDYYLNTGDTATTATTAHHLVIVPDTILASSYMNSTNITTGAYAGSYMYTTTLLQDGTEASDSVFGKIKAAFGESNLLSIRQLFSNAVDSNGNVSGWAWYTTRCFLMNQCMVCGQKAWANGNNDGYNVGIDKSQLALFAHNSTSINTRQTYWLRDVRSSTFFAFVYSDGYAYSHDASRVYGVRPVALLS